MSTRINGPCSACGDGDTAMKYHNHNPDPLATAAETAWLEYAKGTYSSTDKRIFVEGFYRGWRGRVGHVAGLVELDVDNYVRAVEERNCGQI